MNNLLKNKCNVETDDICPFKDRLDLIIENQKIFKEQLITLQEKVEEKFDIINTKLYIGNGKPSFETRVDRLEIAASCRIDKFGYWFSVASLTISGCLIPAILWLVQTASELAKFKH